ncbi:MAG: hypothetical protein ABH874_08735 [Methanobacteriota archaeon]
MEALSKEKIERAIYVVYKELGVKDAVLFFRAISGGKGNFTIDRNKMPEFSDKNVKKIFSELVR